MKKLAFSIIVLGLSIAAAFPVYSRNTKYIRSIAAAIAANDPEEKPNGSVKFFFGTQKSPAILSNFGSYAASPRTNALGKSDERACNLAFLSTLVVLEKRARQLGGNAVVNIISYYDRNEMSSTTDFECHAGISVAVVALKGEIVKVADE